MALSVAKALETLARLQTAAPAGTAARLAEIIALLDDLSEENAYLNAQVQEQADVLASPSPEIAAAPAIPEPTLMDEPVVGESTAFDVMMGMNDALRAPLVAIRGRAELIQAGMLGQITADQAHWLEAIQANTHRAFLVLDAVQRLIALLRQEVRIDWTEFIAAELLEEARERIADRAAARRHTISLQVPDVVPLARGDFYQSLLVLTDLLDNAVRYTPEGGHIRLSVDSLGPYVLFNVADNGIGLRLEDMDNISQPFWRGDFHPLVRQHVTGTGLSLFLARQILALQGGELIFSGEQEVGSTFSFTLNSPH